MSFSLDNPFSTSQTGLFSHYHQRGAQLEDILNRPDAKLEELLDYDDFLYEIRNSNPRLLDYFSQNTDKVRMLLDYMIKVHPDISDKKKSYHYPLLVNEIFEADVPAIMNAFFSTKPPSSPSNAQELSPSNDLYLNGMRQSFLGASSAPKSEGQDLLGYLFSFLTTKGEQNPVLAGYFNRLVQKLLKRNQRKVVEFVLSNEKVLSQMIDHIGNASVAELIPAFFCYESYLFDENSPEFLKIKLESVRKILNTLGNTNQPEEMSNVAEIIGELLKRNETMADGKEILNQMLSKETIDNLFSILNRSSANQVIVQICHVMMTLLAYYLAKNSGPHSPIMSPFQQIGIPDNAVFLAICDNFHVFTKLLSEDRIESLATTFGQNSKPLGRGKLKVVEVLDKIVRLENKKLFRKINESGIIKTLTELFAKNMWNNMLHSTYEKIVYTILDKRDSFLVEALLDKAGFIQFILREIREEQFNLPKRDKKIRKGNIGHIIKMANELERIASFESSIEVYIKKVPEWESVVLPILKSRNEINNVEMGGENPRRILIALGLLEETPTPNHEIGQSPTSGGYQRDSLTYSSSPQADQQQHLRGESFLSYTLDTSADKPKTAAVDFAVEPKSIPAPPQNYAYPPSSYNMPTGQMNLRDSLTLPSISAYTAYGEPPKKENQPQPGSYQTEIKPFTYSYDPLNQNDKPKTEQEQKNPYFYELNSTKPTYSEQNQSKDDGTRLTKRPSNEEPLPKIDSPFDKLFVASHNRSKSDQTTEAFSPFNKELEEDMFGLKARKTESHHLSPISSPVVEKPMRNSMIEMRSGAKVKLTTHTSERLSGNKVLELINRYKGPSTSSSVEFMFANNSQSESENLSYDPVYTRDPRFDLPSFSADYSYVKKEVYIEKGHY